MLQLQGVSVVITRPRDQSAGLAEKLSALGAAVLAIPTIEVRTCHDSEEMVSAVRELGSYDWVVFTSANGVLSFVKSMQDSEVPIEKLASRKLAAIGSETANALSRSARAPDIVPQRFLAREIPDCMGGLNGRRVLLPRADIADPWLPQELARRGAAVTQIAAYCIDQNSESSVVKTIRDQKTAPDLITFTSPSTFRGFQSIARRAGRESWLRESELVAIGPVTASAVTDAGFEAPLVAEPHTSQGIVSSILKWAEDQRRRQ